MGAKTITWEPSHAHRDRAIVGDRLIGAVWSIGGRWYYALRGTKGPVGEATSRDDARSRLSKDYGEVPSRDRMLEQEDA
jgi:hypothetical protein